MNDDDARLLLDAVHAGLAFRSDKTAGPGHCYGVPRNDSDIREGTDVSFEMIEAARAEDLIKTLVFDEYERVVFAYAGRKKHLELHGYDVKRWAGWMDSHVAERCCERALPVDCVCMQRTICDVHGERCHGSHD